MGDTLVSAAVGAVKNRLLERSVADLADLADLAEEWDAFRVKQPDLSKEVERFARISVDPLSSSSTSDEGLAAVF